MNIKTLIKIIPNEEQSFGELDNSVLDKLTIIEDELMKRGTLSGTSIDWDLVQKTSHDVLKKASHITAFRGLVSFLCRNGDDHSLYSAALLGTALYSTHFPKLYPKGKAQLRRRLAWAKEILKTLETGAETVIKTNRGLSTECKAALDDCISAAESAGQDISRLKKISQKRISEVGAKENSHNEPPASVGSPSELDAKGRGLLKRDIRSIADRITEHNPDAGIAYQLRGYAAWLEFQFIPDSDDEGLIQQQEMPSVINDEHRANVSKPTTATLSKIEDRLFMSPDWFVGQKYAYDMAVSLKYTDTAQAIFERTKKRVEQWSGLKKLKYANGRDYVTVDVLEWISQSPSTPMITLDGVVPDNDKNETLRCVIAGIDLEISEALSPRSKALAKLKLARYFSSEGLTAQAEMMFGELIAQISSTETPVWDSGLVSEIKKDLKQLG